MKDEQKRKLEESRVSRTHCDSLGHIDLTMSVFDQSVFDQSVFDHVCVCVQLKREELMKVPPEEMFKSETDKYSQFDEQVLTI